MNGSGTQVASEEVLSINGVGLFTRTIGRGPAVITLHGGPGAGHASLLPEFDALACGRTLRYYDQRGCGRSPTPHGVPLGWQQLVADLEALIGHWQTDDVTLLGYSWGGLLALLHAVSHPQRAARLALVSPAPVTAADRAVFQGRFTERMRDPSIVQRRRALERSNLRRVDLVAYRQEAFRLSIVPYFKDPTDATRITPFVVSQRARESVWRSLGDYDLTTALSRLSVPTLIIHGRHDPIPLSSSERTASLLGAHLEVFEESSHVPFVEEFDRFVAVLDGFLPRRV